MSLNSVVMVGWVGARAEADGGWCTLVVTTMEAGREVPDRHGVLVGASLLSAVGTLAVGQPVYVAGRLQRMGARVCVVADELWPLGRPPAPPPARDACSTHASPRQHLRAGHWRRIGINTSGERLVWVRTATVGAARAR